MSFRDKLIFLVFSVFFLLISFSVDSLWLRFCCLISIPFLFYLLVHRVEVRIKYLGYLLSRLKVGDYRIRAFVDSNDEVGKAVGELNELARYLELLSKGSFEYKERLSGLLCLVEVPVAFFDEIGRLIEANSPFLSLFGESDGRKVKGKWYWQFSNNKDLLEFFDVIKDKGKADSFKISFGNRIFLGKGVFSGGKILVVLKEITQEVQLEERESELISSIAHEIKTPLAAMKGAAETLEGEIGENKLLSLIVRNAERLNDVVSKILALQGLKRRRISKESIKLSELLSGLLPIVEEKAKRKRIRIDVRLSQEDLIMMGERALIESALLNLLDNAINYNVDGGSVTIRAQELEDGVKVVIEDTGIGIPKEHIPYIFEKFYVVDKSRSKRVGGVGLGLSIVKEIVSLHGGIVEVESELGKGSKFTLIFPK
ncbi:MAG: hypothetical protein H5T91_09700 [Synergistetes bacterium]|nr:MAG: Signal transduction histidine kinase [bacterium 42_11]MBC7332676.1 hypothetical protein [Synergistota bacterium]MDK2870936.1 two-component system, OmpR family, phosphate regulon sensor histidine kinase PhoR [bacterium]